MKTKVEQEVLGSINLRNKEAMKAKTNSLPSLLTLTINKIAQNLELSRLLMHDKKMFPHIKYHLLEKLGINLLWDDLEIIILSYTPVESWPALYLTSHRWKAVVEKTLTHALSLSAEQTNFLLLVDHENFIEKLHDCIAKFGSKPSIFQPSRSLNNELSPFASKLIFKPHLKLNFLCALSDFFDAKQKYIEEHYGSLKDAPRNSLLRAVVELVENEFPFIKEDWFKERMPYFKFLPKVSFDIIKQNEKSQVLSTIECSY